MKNVCIRDEEFKLLEDYKTSTQQPYWKIIQDIIEGKINLEDLKLKREKK